MSPLSHRAVSQEVETVFASRAFHPTLQQIKLQQHLFREGTPHQEEIRCIGCGMAVSRRNDGQWRNPLSSRPETGTITPCLAFNGADETIS